MTMTTDHKAALARGRNESHAVRRYLEYINEGLPARRLSRSELVKRKVEVEELLARDPAPLIKLKLVQERIDLEAEIERSDSACGLEDLEAEFVAVARSYAARKGISYAAWRQMGVPARVLADAGIGPSRRA